jgi:hypothetical protein
MATRYANATRSAAANAAWDLCNGGTIQIRTGAQPTATDDAAQGTLLGTLTFSATAFGAATNGAKTANAITSDTTADNSGTAGHARFLTSGAAIVADTDCGQGSGSLSFDNAVVVAGGTIAITALTATQPA